MWIVRARMRTVIVSSSAETETDIAMRTSLSLKPNLHLRTMWNFFSRCIMKCVICKINSANVYSEMFLKTWTHWVCKGNVWIRSMTLQSLTQTFRKSAMYIHLQHKTCESIGLFREETSDSESICRCKHDHVITGKHQRADHT